MLFGEENIINLKNDDYSEDWNKFENEVEKIKKMFDEYEPRDFKLDCRLFEGDNNKSLEDYINDYNKKEIKYKYDIKKVRIEEIDGNY